MTKPLSAFFILSLSLLPALTWGNSLQVTHAEAVTIQQDGLELHGTLTLPHGDGPVPVALIIAGSGPTDRDGNNPAMVNNALKWLAHELAAQGVASLRYDKRGIGQSTGDGVDESQLRFEHYINDARAWLTFLADDSRFSKRWVIGHSEGSLIGMVAAHQSDVDGFVSLAGVGESADQTLKRQLASQPEPYRSQMMTMIDELASGELIGEVDPIFAALFRQSVQPYLISWFRYDPAEEISVLENPVLIVQGTTDLQVGLEDANKLAKANADAELVIIEGMNHVLKEAPMDRAANLATYTQGDMPLADGLIDNIVNFIFSSTKAPMEP